MNKRTLLAAAFAAFISLALAVNAADEPKKKGGGFAAMDTDKDGKVSKGEYMAANKGKGEDAQIEARFKGLDTNNDGFLSAEEFQAGAKKKKKDN